MKDEVIRIRISTEDKERLKKLAEENGLTMSAYINFLMAQSIKKVEKQSQ